MSYESVYHLSVSDSEGVEKIRQLFDGKIPEDLNTDLNLRRWIHGWKGQLNEIEPRLRTYIENRKALKLDNTEFLDTFHQHVLIEKYMKYFGISLEHMMINPKTNNVIVVESAENVNMHNIAKVIPCGEFSNYSFVVCESFLRQILKQEQLSKKPSGLTILYDLSGFHVMDYSNPNAPIHKIMKMGAHVLQDYYCDILQKAYIINAPNFIHIVWNIMKRFLNKNTQEKFLILGHDYKEVLRAEVDLDVLPVRYGGKKRDTSGRVNPETLCTEPVQITVENYYKAKKQNDNLTVEYLKPGAKFQIRKHIQRSGVVLSWHFWTNAEVQFVIIRKDNEGKEDLMTARLTMVTPKLPEEGEIICNAPGEYILEFVNLSTMFFSLKLDYCVEVRKFSTSSN